ncbi:MAG: TonB-dependent receptor [Bacteroidaceae bacterium]|nr:TonB-dependent receptor [Bacteroidaceae bacterium]
MKKLQMLFVFLCMSIGMIMAQTSTITGVVISAEDNEPVIGASVLVKGTTQGSITDLDGAFSIPNVSAKAKTVVVSFVGMRTVEVAIQPNMRVVLHPDAQVMEEVVVTVAYGSAKKSSLTGAISSVDSKQIEARPVSSVTSALEGATSGVQVNSSYGAPGSEPSIRIRGIGTVNGDSSPLYVVDGMPMGGNISDLNPADIESISVLKDAASCALYGNRASNGVVLITTKKGTSQKMSFDLRINQGTYTRGIKEYKLMNANQFMEAAWMNIKNSRLYAGDTPQAAAEYASKNLISDYLYLNIYNKADDALFTADGKLVSDAQILGGYADDLDWYDEAIRSGYRQEYTLSGNAATEKSNYYFSLGYLDEQGYVTNSAFDRLSARGVINITPKKWLSAGVTINATHQNYNNTNGDSSGSYTNAFMYCRNIAPIYPVHLHNPDGSYRLDGQGRKQYDGGQYVNDDDVVVNTRNQYVDRHVIWENEVCSDVTIRNTMQTIAYMDIKFLKDFTFTVKGDLNLRNSENRSYNSAYIGDGKGNGGRAARNNYRYKNYTFQQLLNWNHAFGDHTVGVLLGHENYSNNYNYLYGYKTTQVFEGETAMINFKNITSLYDYENNYRTESYLSRVRYNYKEKYNLEASFRRDGSSRFHKDNRWGNFGSIGANWMMSEEEFMKDVAWVNSLKLRANWGVVGNDAGSGYYGYMGLYTNTQNANQGAYYLSQNEAYDLKWEGSEAFGFGAEARLFNRWNLSVEYFDKRNKDLLFNVNLPLSAGGTSNSDTGKLASVLMNFGTISNRGWEVNTDFDIYKNRDWKINLAANATYMKNKVVELPEQNKDGIIDGTKKIVEGRSRYDFYLYTFEGVDQMTGQSLYKPNLEENYIVDASGNKIGNTEGSDITANVTTINGKHYVHKTTYAQKEFHGSALPKVYGSFTPSIQYKSLSLQAVMTYSLGGKTYDGVYAGLMGAGGTPSGAHIDVAKSWNGVPAGMTETSANRVLKNGIPEYNYSTSSDNNAGTTSRWLTSADYLIMKNITLSYQLPKEWVKKIDLQNVGLSLSCENLFTLTSRQGMNPQQSFGGTQNNYLVTPRVFSFGVQVKL